MATKKKITVDEDKNRLCHGCGKACSGTEKNASCGSKCKKTKNKKLKGAVHVPKVERVK